MYRILLLITLIFSFSLLKADYLLKVSKRQHSKIDTMPKGVIGDMKNIPQDPSYYANQIKPFPKSKQKKLDKLFNEKYFKPWTLTNLDIPNQNFGWEIRFIRKKLIYKAKGSVIPPYIYEQWIDNANYSEIDTKRYRAITTKHTDVKALPTSSSFYRDPRRTGEGFPFDYNQNSSLHINIPLYISHFSKDKKWAFVRASYAFGWVKISDLAIVNKKFIKKFKNNNYAMVIKDNLRLYNENNASLSLVKLGALFPIAKKNKNKKKHKKETENNGTTYLVAKRNKKGQASIHKVKLSNPYILAKKPLPFTAKNVAIVAKQFYGEPYGWGGSYACRDCSATTRDFLGVFGIFLRRNSSKQAQDGNSIPMKRWPKAYKKRFINEHAEPFRSLLYVPGHIVLYLGQYHGEPVIMHTYWGVRKTNGTKIITGRTIITTTEPGKERRDVREGAKLINTLKSIVNF